MSKSNTTTPSKKLNILKEDIVDDDVVIIQDVSSISSPVASKISSKAPETVTPKKPEKSRKSLTRLVDDAKEISKIIKNGYIMMGKKDD